MFHEISINEYILAPFDGIRKPKIYACGIYEVIAPDGKIYVGQSRDIFSRWMYYKSKKCKDQRLIFESFMNFGVENHIFKIVKAFDMDCQQVELDFLERSVMLSHVSNGVEMLNLTVGGIEKTKYSSKSLEWMTKRMEHEPNGSKKRKEKRALSRSLRAKKEKVEPKLNKNDEFYWSVTRVENNLKVFANPVIQLSLDGGFIKEWESMASASRNLNISPKTIRKSLLGIFMPKNKFKWVYKEDYGN